jgi:hypothetical protein
VIIGSNRLHRPELQAGLPVCFLGSHTGVDVLFSLGR